MSGGVVTSFTVHRNWCSSAQGLLDALRTQYSYLDNRATGWLYSERQQDTLPPISWAEPLAPYGPALLEQLEETTGTRFTAACFQAYLDGTSCGWHYDRDWDEQAVLSLGITRKFGLRREGHEEFISLADGDMIFMPSGFQYEWEHCVPPEDVLGERCSIVFRAPA